MGAAADRPTIAAIIPADRCLDISEKQELHGLACEIRELTKLTAQAILTIGERLARAKKLLGYGRFLKWTEEEFGWSDRTARRFMQVHEAVGPKIEKLKLANLANLEIDASALYLLACGHTPGPVVEEVLARARNGERISHSYVRGLVTNEFENRWECRESTLWDKNHPSPPDLSGDICRVDQVVEIEKRRKKGPVSPREQEKEEREISWVRIPDALEMLANTDLDAHGEHFVEYFYKDAFAEDLARYLPSAIRALQYLEEGFVRAGLIKKGKPALAFRGRK
jgi:hypothetical protein